jgi:hypothetical protein
MPRKIEETEDAEGQKIRIPFGENEEDVKGPDKRLEDHDAEGHGGGKWSGLSETEDDTQGHRRS